MEWWKYSSFKASLIRIKLIIIDLANKKKLTNKKFREWQINIITLKHPINKVIKRIQN